MDKTFPANDYSMCILSPKLVECGRHPNIRIHTQTEVVDLEGKPGAFTARLRQKARYISLEKWIARGACAEKCPNKVSDELNPGLNKRKAAYAKYPQRWLSVAKAILAALGWVMALGNHPAEVPTHAGRRGHPPLLSRALTNNLMAWTREGGLRTFLKDLGEGLALAPVCDPGIHQCLHSPEHCRAALGLWSAQRGGH